MRIILSVVVSLSLSVLSFAAGSANIRILKSKYSDRSVPEQKIIQNLKKEFKSEEYREIRAQVIYNEKHQPDHLLVYLHSKTQHRVDISAVKVDFKYNFLSVEKNYQLKEEDTLQQPGIRSEAAVCPDTKVQFIGICPNNDEFEQGITDQAVAAAKAKGLVTVKLDSTNGTRTNWLNYMACPNLKGNFYDGDSNPEVVVTSDGQVSSGEIKSALTGQFKHNVTNVWVACEAFNDPMKGVMIDDAQSKKYAAGINNLQVGPSDNAAVCAIKAFLEGKAMTASFQTCYEQLDNKDDQWGFGGNGSDIF